MGTSLGGFLAARAAAFEHRLAALIVHDAIFDTRSGLRSLPPRRVSKGSTATPRRPIRQPRHRDPGSFLQPSVTEQLAAVADGAAPSQRHSRAGSAPAPQVPHIRSGSLTETSLTWSQRPLIAECYAQAQTLKPTGSIGIHSRRFARNRAESRVTLGDQRPVDAGARVAADMAYAGVAWRGHPGAQSRMICACMAGSGGLFGVRPVMRA